jgi:hypothetical protein
MSDLFLPVPVELPDYNQGTQPCTPERLAGRKEAEKAGGKSLTRAAGRDSVG